MITLKSAREIETEEYDPEMVRAWVAEVAHDVLTGGYEPRGKVVKEWLGGLRSEGPVLHLKPPDEDVGGHVELHVAQELRRTGEGLSRPRFRSARLWFLCETAGRSILRRSLR